VRAKRAGSTLVELIVTLALLAVIFTVVAFALPGRRPVVTTKSIVSDARARAIAMRRPVTIVLSDSSQPLDVTVLPDGQVIADSALHLDRLTGRAADAP